jgi:hypothetical protein
MSLRVPGVHGMSLGLRVGLRVGVAVEGAGVADRRSVEEGMHSDRVNDVSGRNRCARKPRSAGQGLCPALTQSLCPGHGRVGPADTHEEPAGPELRPRCPTGQQKWVREPAAPQPLYPDDP